MEVASNYTKIPNDLIRGSKLTPYEKAVAVYLLSLQFKGSGRIYPSHKTIAVQVNISESAVKEALAGLRARQIIDWESGDLKNRKANLYQLLAIEGWILGLPGEPISGRQATTNKTKHNKTEGGFKETPLHSAALQRKGKAPQRKGSAGSKRFRLDVFTTTQDEPGLDNQTGEGGYNV